MLISSIFQQQPPPRQGTRLLPRACQRMLGFMTEWNTPLAFLQDKCPEYFEKASNHLLAYVRNSRSLHLHGGTTFSFLRILAQLKLLYFPLSFS